MIQEGFEPPTHGLEELKISLYTIYGVLYIYKLQISITLGIYILQRIYILYFIAKNTTELYPLKKTSFNTFPCMYSIYSASLKNRKVH